MCGQICACITVTVRHVLSRARQRAHQLYTYLLVHVYQPFHAQEKLNRRGLHDSVARGVADL